MALKNDGTVWAWGWGDGGIGDGTTNQYTTPIQLPGLTGAVAIAAGDSHSMCIKNDGTLWAWGANDRGQLGVEAASFPYHLLRRCWGFRAWQRLRAATTTRMLSPTMAHCGGGETTGIPQSKHLALRARLRQRLARADALVVEADGTLWDPGYCYCSYPIYGPAGAAAAAAGYEVSAVLECDGSVWTVGDNEDGELGEEQDLGL